MSLMVLVFDQAQVWKDLSFVMLKINYLYTMVEKAGLSESYSDNNHM